MNVILIDTAVQGGSPAGIAVTPARACRCALLVAVMRSRIFAWIGTCRQQPTVASNVVRTVGHRGSWSGPWQAR